LRLTNEEEHVLKGESGEGPQKAMELLAAIGDAFEAERMIPVTCAHVARSGQEGDLYFVEMLAKGGASCKIPTTVNPIVDFDYFQNVIDATEYEASMARKVKEYYREIGAILSDSCVPYLVGNLPAYGEHVAFSESSVTCFANSVLGAATNREASVTALAAGIIGSTPDYGLHQKDKRRGTILVEVEANLKDGYSYSLLGQYVGKKVGYGTPVFVGIRARPTIDQYTNLCVCLNVAGAIPMFHIPGLTVEARTLDEAFGGNVPQDKIVVTDHDLQQTHEELQTSTGDIDFVLLGCPHYSLSQLAELGKLLKGKRIRGGVSFWVNTSAATRLHAGRTGYVRAIEEAGAEVIVDTCVDMFCWNNLRGKIGMTDSPKCAYYRRFGLSVKVGSMEECVAASVEKG
jgi:predicted aconitase